MEMCTPIWKVVLIAGAALLVLSGCESMNFGGSSYKPKDNVFDYEGMLDDQYLVGGGYFIVYRAKVEGVLYLADDSSDRLLATISLEAGEDHEIIYDITDEKLATNLESLGIDPKKAVLKLYFVPN